MSASEPINPVSLSGSVVSVQVGTIARLGPRKVPSAFVKRPVTGAVMAKPPGLVADQQADLHVHGGPDKAIYCYPIAHYAKWLDRKGTASTNRGLPAGTPDVVEASGCSWVSEVPRTPVRCSELPCIIHQARHAAA